MVSVVAIRTVLSVLEKEKATIGISSSQKKYVVEESGLMLLLSNKLWKMLDISFAVVHYQIAELLLKVRKFSEAPVKVIEEAMKHSSLSKREEGHQKFALLWRLTGELGMGYKPFAPSLFIMLDSLHSEQPVLRLAGRSWLAESISKIERLLDPLLELLLSPFSSKILSSSPSLPPYPTKKTRHVLKVLRNIIDCDFRLFMKYVIEQPPSKLLLSLHSSPSHSSSLSSSSSSLNSSLSSSLPLTFPSPLFFFLWTKIFLFRCLLRARVQW